METTQLVAAVGFFAIMAVGVLLAVWIVSRRSEARGRSTAMPVQRSPLTEAELIKLNQEYGNGQIGEAEYRRRRAELFSRAE